MVRLIFSVAVLVSIALTSNAQDIDNNLRGNGEVYREECNFKCPPDMWCKANRDCYNNLDDCLDREPDDCNFKCPQDTVCRRKRVCFDSIKDCRPE